MAKITISGFYDEVDGSLDKQIALLKELGETYMCPRTIDGKNISAYTVEEFAEKIKPRLDANGIKFSSIGSPIGKVGLKDETGFEKQKNQLKELIKIAQLMDCKYIRIFSFFVDSKGDFAEYKPIVFKKLKEFIDIAEDSGVVLLHENEKGIYGAKADKCLEIAKEFYGKNFALAFDSSNFVQCDDRPLEAYKLLKEYVKYIHVKDCSKYKVEVPLGMGEGDYKEIFTDLVEQGFEGFATMEPHTLKYALLKKPFYAMPFVSLIPPLKHYRKVFRSIDKAYGKKAFQTVTRKEVFLWQYENLTKLLKEVGAR